MTFRQITEYGIKDKILHFFSYVRDELTAKRLMNDACALTYSSLLAIVPILAVVFAVARGFGYNKYIEQWFLNTLSSQPQAADAIVGFVNSYLVHTRKGVFLGVGLLVMLWTVIMLVRNIERAFNHIWQVTHPRPFLRTLTDYTALVFLIPVFLVVSSGISILMTTALHDIEDYFLLGSVMRLLVSLLPYALMSIAFISLYVFMPNTKVYLKNAVIPGVLAGVAMQALQFVYIHSQVWMTSHNAIYGSFAALPLFMLWLQFSWIICLSGAELCYMQQNLEYLAFRSNTNELSHRYQMMLSALLLKIICQRFEKGKQPYTALELKLETGIPIRITRDLLYNMQKAKLILEVYVDEKEKEPFYQPAVSPEHLSVGLMVERLEALGKWKLSVDLSSLHTGEASRSLHIRKEYIERQSEVLFKDL